MINKKINSLQFGMLIFFVILASQTGIGINLVTSLAGRDSIVSVLFAYFLGLIPVGIFIYLFNQDGNIIDLINDVFGKKLGLVVNLLLLIPILVISATTLNSICNFLVSQFLTKTPLSIIYMAVVVVILYAVFKGIEVVSRTAVVLSVISILFLVISIIGLIPSVKIDNFFPLFENGIMKDVSASFLFGLTNITPLFILLFLSKENISNSGKVNKSILLFYSFGILSTLIGTVLTIGTLGVYLTKIYQYPEYMMLKKISFFNFFNRVENLIAIQWLHLNLLVTVLSIFYARKVFKKDNSKVIPIAIMILIFVFSKVVFRNNTMFTTFNTKIYPYVNLGYFVLISLIAVVVFIKRKPHKLL